ncbi:proteasome-activating nucleotidase [Candidatus Woesearchaeota archaeon]|jgi:proteasome regulatory subunit|nr:proteasome-activating nucleotidase [Candidatus Woesearchaeota archaeon]MDP6647947.1 AAA family ATPase [Candidatus Woesearchaeota archaeon]|tara:strand:+ start:12517 stop:13680 length:1164 start_codon:yes stop_codon:yes gene_type:complete
MPTKEASKSKDKNIIDSIMYTYSTSSNPHEEENRILKETINRLKEENERFKTSPLMVCEVKELFGKQSIIRIPNGNQFLVNISDGCDKIKSGDLVLVEQKNLTVIRKVPITRRFNIEKYVIIEKPTISWHDIGGLSNQVQEIKEVVELPLLKPELFKKVGITPPKGVLLYGEPGTGKTLLAKAVAASTNSTFIEIVGSELVQKFIGEGAKLVKEIFEFARKKAPAIVFIDELDALAAKRIEVGTSGEREVNRTFMQLLAELDGFKPLDNVKVIGATNRKDILDPAVIRPGRLDRLIYISIPNKESRKEIFKIHTKRMTFSKGINAESLITRMEGFSGAEIKAVCTEAGYFAIRSNRSHVTKEDFLKAIDKVKQEEKAEGQDHVEMFG